LFDCSTTSSNRSQHRAEGKADQTVGEVKQVAENAVDNVKEAVKKLRD
jgi:uncharacterized protein YjbJ (UPF0337 family)